MPDVPVVPLALVAALALLLVAVAGLFTVRRLLLSRAVGSFDCSLRRPGAGTWSIGVARYAQGRLDWFGIFSLSPRPAHCWAQSAIGVVGRRPAEGPEVYAVLPGSVIVRCRAGDADIELAMSQDAYTGFASWLEAAPPGRSGEVT